MKEIKLSLSKHGQFFTKVDDEDFDWLSKFKWSVKRIKNKRGSTFYAAGVIDGINTYMSRLIMKKYDPTSILDVDHRDLDSLNNQKNNLRRCTQSQNCMNRFAWGKIKYKGVYLNKKQSGRYSYIQSRIQINKKPINLGFFKSEIEAAKAYDVAAKKYFGEFAKLNFA